MMTSLITESLRPPRDEEEDLERGRLAVSPGFRFAIIVIKSCLGVLDRFRIDISNENCSPTHISRGALIVMVISVSVVDVVRFMGSELRSVSSEVWAELETSPWLGGRILFIIGEKSTIVVQFISIRG